MKRVRQYSTFFVEQLHFGVPVELVQEAILPVADDRRAADDRCCGRTDQLAGPDRHGAGYAALGSDCRCAVTRVPPSALSCERPTGWSVC